VKDGIKFIDFGVQLVGILWFAWLAADCIRTALAREHADAARTKIGTDTGSGSPYGRGDWKIAVGIAVGFYVLCLIRLDVPNRMYFDEVHHVRTAMEYIIGHDPHEWTHPPLAKLIMAASMKIAGVKFDPTEGVWNPDATFPAGNALVWRLPSVCFGALSLIGLFTLARCFFKDRLIATSATILLALDGVFLVQSRIAMTNIHTVCFIIAATIGTWKFIETNKSRWLLLTGIMLGLAIATRWSSLWAWGFTGLVLLWHLFRNQIPQWFRERKQFPNIALWISAVSVTMILIPLMIYAASYIPFVLQGTGGWKTQLFTSGESGAVRIADAFRRDHFAGGHGWFKALNQQKDMWLYHTEIKEGHPYSSPWWSWPLMMRPVWYEYDETPAGTMGIWCIGNGIIWWASVPALLAAIYFARRDKRPELGIIALFGLGMWLAWGIKPRPLIFMHYYFECIPFVCLALAYIGVRLWRSEDAYARRFVRIFCIAVVLWAIFFYPLLADVPMPVWFYQSHIWFGRGWV